MEKIILLGRTTKNSGEIKIRFRLLDGRKADLFHKTDLRATAEELEKFDKYGNLKPRIKIYNSELADGISREIGLIKKVYKEMLDNGYDLTSEVLEQRIQIEKNPVQAERDKGDTLLALYKNYADSALRDGVVGENRYSHFMVVYGKLERFLKIQGQTKLTAREFDGQKLMVFRHFVFDEYKYVKKYPALYKDFTPKNLPTARLSMNTVASQMKMLQTFFNSLDDGQIERSPFAQLGKEKKKVVMKTLYDEPYFLREDEFKKVMKKKVPVHLNDTKNAFLLQCAIGCRIGDFQTLTMDNVAVSPEGIPYLHYLPSKTKMAQLDNKEIVTPLVRFAFDIVKRTQFKLKEVKYAAGANGYNAKIKALLKACGIDRKVPVFNEETKANEYTPLWQLGSSKLCRKTHVDMM
ncbi:MAG: hypothetical protein II761_03135, partial [Bacteroidales bacterium]|nr:hypothetical protein [Bacteroidales bacterium]